MLRYITFCCTALMLAACTGGGDVQNGSVGVLREASQAIQTARAPAPALPQVTRALLDGLTVPSLEAVIEDGSKTAYMIPLETRGNLRVWLAPDGTQLVLRNGVVIETRGLGHDLVASTQTGTLAALDGAGGAHDRRYQLTNDLDQRRALDLTCRIDSRSNQTVTIVERDFAAQYVRQICEGEGVQITNEFWRDSHQPGRIWQSRQWLGPQNGYVRLRLLRP